jgi:8-oxo-dGTP pyrophosphatase MutT (NUDIX family)
MKEVSAACYCAERGPLVEREVLLTRRALWNPISGRPMRYAGEWVFPGGRQDLEDTNLLKTAIREFREELRYAGRFLNSRWFHSARRLAAAGDHTYLASYFIGNIDPEPYFELPAQGEVLAFRWMTPLDALDFIHSPEFQEEQQDAFSDYKLGDSRFGRFAIRERQMPYGTIQALEVLVAEEAAMYGAY